MDVVFLLFMPFCASFYLVCMIALLCVIFSLIFLLHFLFSQILHTTMGDIHMRLYPEECPKTVENFTTHCRNGYYDNLIFHRVIKGFMVQTGDPLGDGTGGQSIWGREFEDEFHKRFVIFFFWQAFSIGLQMSWAKPSFTLFRLSLVRNYPGLSSIRASNSGLSWLTVWLELTMWTTN